MKILKKLTPYAKLSFVIGSTSKYDKGQVQVTDSVANEVYNKMISAIKIEQTDLALVTLRNPYIEDKVYPQYSVNTNDMCHVTVDDNVYICLSNNNGAISKTKPSGTLLNNIIKPDGYVWAFIGHINDVDVGNTISKYITIPQSAYSTNEIGSICRIKNIEKTTTNFDAPPKYKVSSLTGSNAIFDISLDDLGEINYIACANGGFGYTEEDVIAISDNFDGQGAVVNLKITNGGIDLVDFTSGSGYNDCSILVVGDGTGAILDFATLNGSVTNVSVQDAGTGYTWAKAFVFSSARAILGTLQMMPLNGRATDPSILLRANTWRINKTIDTTTYEGYVYENMSFNYVAVVDQYSTPLVAGLNNKYTGNIQLKYATDVKEVYAINKMDNNIVVNKDDKINLIITIKLDG
jgi:hypothetical protein